jgi:hypothetical protein
MTILIKKEAVKLLYKCKNNIILEVKLIPTTETEGGGIKKFKPKILLYMKGFHLEY